MNKIALTLLTFLLLLGTIFALPNTIIIEPTLQQIATNSIDINFAVFEVTDINQIQIDCISPIIKNIITDNNIYDNSQIICVKDTNFYCNYNWDTTNEIDSNNYQIRITLTSTPIAPPQINSNLFTLDKTPPTISYKFPDNNKWIHPELANFSFYVNDATSGVDVNSFVVSLDGNLFDTNNSTRFNYNSLTNVLDFNGSDLNLLDGNFYTLTLDVNDLAKNKRTIDLNFWVDRNGPYAPDFNLPLTQKDNNVILTWIETIVTSDVNYFVWKSDFNDSNFYPLFGPTKDLNYTDSNTLPDTNYCYFIQTINSYGIDKNTSTYCILIDQTAPLLNDFTGTQQGNTYTILFNFDANDTGIGIEKYWIKLSDTNWIDISATKTYTVPSVNGNYLFTGKVTDFAGNDSNDFNYTVPVNVTSSSGGSSSTGSSGGGSGGIIRGGTITITNTDINEIILEEEREEKVILPESIDSNFIIEEKNENTTDTNSFVQAPVTGTGLFGLDNLIRISFWPILLIIGLFLLLLIISKRRNKEDSWGGGNRIMVEDDIDDLKVNMFSGKWGYKK
jgi:hypothetical protein